MDDINKTVWTSGELTCAQGCYINGGCVYVGAADGSVRAVAANVPSDPNDTELPLTQANWVLRVSVYAVTSICGLESEEKEMGTLLLVGSASGELIVLREDMEIRRFQVESTVQHICYNASGEFIVGDALGNLYGVTQYKIRWKRRLPVFDSSDNHGSDYFYPALAQPTVQAITHARLLDVEKTLSNYILVTTGQKNLVLTHCGKSFGTIPTRTPIVALVSIPVDDQDIVLASGEEGIIYRLESYRDMGSKDMPDLRFAMKMWVQVSFPVLKLVSVKIPDKTNTSEFAWICLGVDGEVALFRGQERVKQWRTASFFNIRENELNLPVDLTMLDIGNAEKQQIGAIVFTDRIYTFSIEQWLK